MPVIKGGHLHFGENRVQEAEEKWLVIKKNNPKIQLHLIGKLQTNKVKNAVKVFNYIHSLDSYKLAESIAKQSNEVKQNLKFFIQVNIGEEIQKSGIHISKLEKFVSTCKNEMSLNIIGLMCLPPINKDVNDFFLKMQKLKNQLNLKHLSMGMSNDYLKAIKYDATFLRIGSKIFGQRD